LEYPRARSTPCEAMKRAVCVVLLLALSGVALAVSDGGKVGSPVERVVNLLKDLKEKLEMDEKTEQKVYDKYACWCEKTEHRKAGAITEAQLQLRDLGQEVLSLKGKAATLASEIEQLEAEIMANKKAQEEATAMRQKENEAFMEEADETKQALAALEKATTVLVAGSKPSAFLQTRAKAVVKNVVAAMPVSKPLKAGQLTLLSEFLSSDAGAKYTPQSATVQGMLKDMYETFAADLQSATEAEAASNANYESFIAVKVAELKADERTKKKKEEEKADSEAQLADTQQMYDDTTAQKKADIVFFDETKGACQAKHDEWTTRSSLREEEIAGVAQALEVLTSDDARELFASAIKAGKEVGAEDKYDTGRDITSFLQVGSDAAPMQRAYAALKSQASAAHSLRLAMLAVQVHDASGGHFEKVLISINKMVQVLKDEDTADIEKRDQCKDEYKNIESTVKDVSWKIEVNEAKIEKLTKLIERLEQENEQTIKEIKDVTAFMGKITNDREIEHVAFLNSKKEDQDAIDLLMEARNKLESYYKNHSIALGPIQGSVKGLALSQQPDFEVSADQASDAVFSDKSKRKGESKNILSLMTMIIEDLNDEIKNGMKAEEAAMLEYEKQTAAAQKLKDELIAKEHSLTESIAKRGADKSDEISDKDANDKDLKDELAYKDSITPDCDWILGAFSKRSEARTAEMNGLVAAKEFLAGYKPPSEQSALIEKAQAEGKTFDDAALRNVRFLGLGR